MPAGATAKAGDCPKVLIEAKARDDIYGRAKQTPVHVDGLLLSILLEDCHQVNPGLGNFVVILPAGQCPSVCNRSTWCKRAMCKTCCS